MATHTFVIARKNLRETRWVDAPQRDLSDGEVRLKIASFALTCSIH